MASGETHARLAIASQIPLTVLGVAALFVNASFGVGLVAGGVIGIVVTPDIDHHNRTHEEKRVYEFDRTLGIIWQWLWSGYALTMPHRGISHMPIVGTITRIVYVALLLKIVFWVWNGAAADACYVAGCSAPKIDSLVLSIAVPDFWIGLVIGWIVQDFVHIVTDWMTPVGME